MFCIDPNYKKLVDFLDEIGYSFTDIKSPMHHRKSILKFNDYICINTKTKEYFGLDDFAFEIMCDKPNRHIYTISEYMKNYKTLKTSFLSFIHKLKGCIRK